MFDIGWSELLIISVIAIIVVGPKDLPRMLRTLGQYTRKMRSMAGEFKSQFNEALEEADLADIKKDVESLRSIDPLKDVKEELSPFKNLGGDLKNTIENPVANGSQTSPTIPHTTSDNTEPKTPVEPKRRASPRSVAQNSRTGSQSSMQPKKPAKRKKPAAKPPKNEVAGQ